MNTFRAGEERTEGGRRSRGLTFSASPASYRQNGLRFFSRVAGRCASAKRERIPRFLRPSSADGFFFFFEKERGPCLLRALELKLRAIFSL